MVTIHKWEEKLVNKYWNTRGNWKHGENSNFTLTLRSNFHMKNKTFSSMRQYYLLGSRGYHWFGILKLVDLIQNMRKPNSLEVKSKF